MQQHVTATHHSNKSLHVYWIIFVKIFVSETEFCRCNKLHKFSIIWFFTTGCSNKILFQRQRFSQKFRLQYTWNDLSRKRIAATFRWTCTQGVICHGDILLKLVTYCVRTFSDYLTQSKKGKKIKSGGEVGSVHRLGLSIRAKERIGEVAVSRSGWL